MPTTTLTRDVPVHRVIWFDRSSKDVLSVKEKRRRTASTCSWQDWKTKGWKWAKCGFSGCFSVWEILTYRKEMVKSAQCIFSTVPQLQTEEKNFPTFSHFHRPIHHRCLNSLKTDFVLTFLMAHQTFLVSVDQGTHLLFHSACWEHSCLPDVQPERSSQPHSCHRWRSCSELCPQLNVEASLGTPTDLEAMIHTHLVI